MTFHDPDRLDAPAGRSLALEGEERADDHADEDWRNQADDVMRWCAQRFDQFTSDQFWRRCTELGLDTPERRAFAAVKRRAVHQGLIVDTGQYRKSERPRAHSNPKAVYQSLIHPGGTMTTFADPATPDDDSPKPPPNVVRGPADADNYRIKVGRFNDRWYRDPLPADDIAPGTDDDEAYPSVSTVKKASGKDWTYTSLKRIANCDDLEAIAAKSHYERYERMKVINSLDLSAAMRRGTNVHTWAECIAYGVPQTLDRRDEGGAYFDTVDRLFADLDPTLIAAEFVCIHRNLHGHGYGGTSDGIFEIDGKRYMIDWKSRGEDSDHAAYPEEAAQIGAYCGAEYIITEDPDERNPHGARRRLMPELDGGLIVSIKPDSYEVYPVDIPNAIDHFHAMHAWWTARRTERKALGSKWAPRRTVVEEVEDAITDGVSDAERRVGLYDRLHKLSKVKQQDFADQLVSRHVDKTDLDAVEEVLAEIENPPTVLDMAQKRMEKDAEREADRRLSLEGGPADEADKKALSVLWKMGMSDEGRRWVTDIVAAAEDAGLDVRLKTLDCQRRADIFRALVEWTQTDYFEPNTDPEDAMFRAVLHTASEDDDDGALGVLVGQLSTTEAAEMRSVVSKIEAGEMTYVIDADSDQFPRWEPEPSESQSESRE